MRTPLRVLLLEDDANDAELLLQELRRVGFAPDWQRVETESEYLSALDPALDIILADYRQPQFNAPRALQHLRRRDLDIPFIVVTGLFEEVALECIQQGATDYLLKDRLGRLGAAVTHALEQKALREARRQADASLRESEERFRSLVQNLSDVISVLSADGTIRYVTPSVKRLLGYSPEELVGTDGWSVVHPADVRRVQERVRRTLGEPEQGNESSSGFATAMGRCAMWRRARRTCSTTRTWAASF
jgi:PAS domain S-box-containing protein